MVFDSSRQDVKNPLSASSVKGKHLLRNCVGLERREPKTSSQTFAAKSTKECNFSHLAKFDSSPNIGLRHSLVGGVDAVASQQIDFVHFLRIVLGAIRSKHPKTTINAL